MGDELMSLEALNFIKNFKSKYSHILHLCNPVLGNKERGLYVDSGLLHFYRDYALKLANILVLNNFEAEILSMQNIYNIDDAKLAAKKLIEISYAKIIISGLRIEGVGDKKICTLLFDTNNFYIIERAFISFKYTSTGLGDMLSALFLGNYLNTNNSLKSFLKSISSIDNILEINKKTKNTQLELVKGQEKITKPDVNFVINKL